MNVVGIGETVLDIVFEQKPDLQVTPLSSKPGGSVYNSLISIARSGIHCSFISEVGNDMVGDVIRNFLRLNGIDDSCVVCYDGTRSPLALAFLDDDRNARYQFYKDYASQRVDFVLPQMSCSDVLLFASFFAINPAIRSRVLPALQKARNDGALLYYDLNFRSSHSHEARQLLPAIRENMQLANVVKCSDEDIFNIFATNDWRAVYRDVILPLCPFFICTQGPDGATLLTPDAEFHVDAQRIKPVSTIGAGDSFNAGVIVGLNSAGFSSHSVTPESLAQAMEVGVRFSSEVCMSLDNYIAPRPML